MDWAKLRPWNNSQNAGFEELCCPLAGEEEMPDGAEFIRKAAPDAGVECYWKLPSGEEYGWQAKFFKSPPNDSQWQQINKSVKTAIEKHPRITKYIICLPIDRQDPRIDEKMCFMDRWNNHDKKWKAWAEEKGMSVEFEYWGQHQIGTRLGLDKHSGRGFFWFNEEYLCEEWFKRHLGFVIKNAGARYTRELKVEVPISKVFDALGRTKEYELKLKQLIRKMRTSYARSSSKTAREYARSELDRLDGCLQECVSGLNSFSESSISRWNMEDAEGKCRGTLAAIDEVKRKLLEGENELRKKESAEAGARIENLRSELYDLRESTSSRPHGSTPESNRATAGFTLLRKCLFSYTCPSALWARRWH